MTQQAGDDPQSGKPGEYLLHELKAMHNALRHDLTVCRALADQVAAGAAPEHIRAQITSLQTSSPLWKLRANCLYYCRFVHTHHTIEDVALFPALRRANPGLGPVVDKLMADHRQVSSLLDEIEAGANALLSGRRDGCPHAGGRCAERPRYRPPGPSRVRGGSHRTHAPGMGGVAMMSEIVPSRLIYLSSPVTILT